MKNEKFQHIMLDIETMDSESYSAIISIGAVRFNIETGELGEEFYCNVSLQSCLDLGMTVSEKTIMWWLMQSEEARMSLVNRETFPLNIALEKFTEFCDKNSEIWGNSPRFDCGILQNGYQKVGIPIPWNFRLERCLRTLVSFDPEIKNNFPKIGTTHNALDDCKYQIGYCVETWKKK